MGKEKQLYFKLLGSFSYGYGENAGGKDGISALKAGKKALSFLQYLIVHHERSVSSEELIETFWPDGSNDPGGALRYMLFKVRALLKTMFPAEGDLLLTLPGCYVWNPEISLTLDSRQFEDTCLAARRASKEERTGLLLQAASLYKGDFLSANDSEWVVAVRQYYRALYLDACKAVLPLLNKEERWLEILSVCEQAYRTDFAIEDFTSCAMRALIALGQPEQAVEKYEAFRLRMQEEFELAPGERVEQLYALALGLGKKDLDVSDILRVVCEEDSDRRAFFCTFEMFQSIVALERRHLTRSDQTSSVVVVSLGKGRIPVTDVRRLERTLLEGLRAGDPVARLEAGSYIVMLTGADLQNARMVMSRLDRSFHKVYRRSRANITYHVASLSSWKDAKKEETDLSEDASPPPDDF